MAQQFTGSLVSYPARVSFAAYSAAILLGGFILTLPISRVPDKPPITLVDGIFTATSACCVTGLTVRSTLNDFSFFGQAVILVLIQLGGLGIMTLSTLVASNLGGQATLHQRAVITETLGVRAGHDVRWIAGAVLVTVFVAEACGFAALLAAGWSAAGPGGANWGEVVWKAAFHSISAFCNAGFALGDDNLMPDAGAPVVNIAICSLIIVGGIGFPVIFDVYSRVRAGERIWDRLHMQSKLMLIGTAALLAFGAASFWLLEWDDAIAGRSLGTKFLMGLFHSTTCRTAGFNTVDYGTLSSATLFLTIILMAIGAGPCSTGGGFKVSTFMTLAIRAWSSFHGLKNANFCRRTIPSTAVERSTVTALLFAAIAIFALIAVLVVEKGGDITGRSRWFLEALFECISALGTVGLSTGITPLLSDPGKIVLVGLMLAGRLGPITVAVALSREQRTYQPTYPEEAPLIG